MTEVRMSPVKEICRNLVEIMYEFREKTYRRVLHECSKSSGRVLYDLCRVAVIFVIDVCKISVRPRTDVCNLSARWRIMYVLILLAVWRTSLSFLECVCKIPVR